MGPPTETRSTRVTDVADTRNAAMGEHALALELLSEWDYEANAPLAPK